MIDLENMLQKAVEAKGKEVSFPAEEAEVAIIAAIRAVNASHKKEAAETGYKNLQALHQETYKDLQDARAENERLREALLAMRFAVDASVSGVRKIAVTDWSALIVAADAALSQPAEQPPLMIRCQVCEHHTPVVLEPEPAQREGS